MAKRQKRHNKSKNDDDNCFLYAVTVALNNENSRNNPERIQKFKPFINSYN